jgi:hypothetical protein
MIHMSPPPHSSQGISVLLWKKDGGDGAVGLGDDPDALPSYRVGAEDAIALAQGDLVLAAVEGTELSPVTSRVTGQIVEGVPTALPEEIQGPWSGYDPPEGELGRHRPLFALKTILGGFEATLGPVTSMPPRETGLTGPPSLPLAPPD